MQCKVFIFCIASADAIYSVPFQDLVAMQDPRVARLAINVEKSCFENARSKVSTITVYIIIIILNLICRIPTISC